jgi:ComF family protein
LVRIISKAWEDAVYNAVNGSQPWEKVMVYGRWRTLAAWLWPSVCVLCRAATGTDEDFCSGCRADLPWIKTACPLCALPSSSKSACGACQRKRPPVSRAVAALRYATPIDRLVAGLKYHRRLELAHALGDLLATKLSDVAERPDLLVPVPLHSSRLRERGYNQALEIARVVAARLNIPLQADAARRVRATATQTALPLKQRSRNVRNAFRVTADEVTGKHVALVDDVMTSGHTVNALAKALRRAGAREVSVWVVARA